MNINFLDHLAIRVSDPEITAQWYEKTLGLTRFNDEERWGYPILMQAGSTGVALFPAFKKDDLAYVSSCMHIAFNVDGVSFRKFIFSFQQQGLKFSLEDHHFFHSVYIKDPDGYSIELITPTNMRTSDIS